MPCPTPEGALTNGRRPLLFRLALALGVIAAGASGIAVIRAILAVDDPGAATRALLAAIG